MTLRPYHSLSPTLGANAFVAENAIVIGDVTLGAESSIWFGCVVRGDVNHIRIGARTNVQDGSVIHVTRKTCPTLIGSNVTIGHSVVLHGCTLEDSCFVGMRATIMDNAVVESGAWVAAGALVSPHKRVPSGQIWAGTPARFLRPMTDEEKAFIAVSSQNYVELAREYLKP